MGVGCLNIVERTSVRYEKAIETINLAHYFNTPPINLIFSN